MKKITLAAAAGLLVVLVTFVSLQWGEILIWLKVDPRWEVIGRWELVRSQHDHARLDYAGLEPALLEFDRRGGLRCRRQREDFILSFDYRFEGEQIVLTRRSPEFLYRGSVTRGDDGTLALEIGASRYEFRESDQPFPNLPTVEEFYATVEIELAARGFCAQLVDWNEGQWTLTRAISQSLEEFEASGKVEPKHVETLHREFEIVYERLGDRRWSCSLTPKRSRELHSFFADQSGVLRWDAVETATSASEAVD